MGDSYLICVLEAALDKMDEEDKGTTAPAKVMTKYSPNVVDEPPLGPKRSLSIPVLTKERVSKKKKKAEEAEGEARGDARDGEDLLSDELDEEKLKEARYSDKVAKGKWTRDKKSGKEVWVDDDDSLGGKAESSGKSVVMPGGLKPASTKGAAAPYAVSEHSYTDSDTEWWNSKSWGTGHGGWTGYSHWYDHDKAWYEEEDDVWYTSINDDIVQTRAIQAALKRKCTFDQHMPSEHPAVTANESLGKSKKDTKDEIEREKKV